MKNIVILIFALVISYLGYGQSAKAEEFNIKGNEILSTKDYSGAIESYNKAIEVDPNYAMAYRNRGVAKTWLGQNDEAIKDYDRAIAIDSKFAMAYNDRALANANSLKYDEAIKDYDQSILLDPKASTYGNRGDAKIKLNQFDEAIKDFNQAITLDPKLERPYLGRGTAKRQLGKYQEAIADYDQVIAINPSSSVAYSNRGYTKSNLERFDDAIKDFDKAIAINPKYTYAFLYRGDAKKSLGRTDDAIKDYDQVISIDPKLTMAYLTKAVAKRQMGQYDAAIKDIEQALVVNPKLSEAYYQLGKCYYKQNNSAKANEYFNMYLSSEKNNPTIACYAKFYLGQRDIAFNEMEEIAKNKANSVSHYSLASIYAMAGETDNAIKNLEIALSKGYSFYTYMQNDENLEFIRYKPGYIELLKKYNIVNTNVNIALSKIITSEVKAVIIKWQEKGEFETNAAYTERMKSRDVEVNKVTAEVTERLKKEVLNKISWDIASIGKYDTEGETFKINFEEINSIIVKVPLTEAQSFKSAFKTYKIIKKDLVLSNEQWVISELVCANPVGTKSYKYDIKNQPDYNPNQLFSLNFDALNIKVDQYSGVPSQIHNSSKTIVIGKDPVDIDIPVNPTSNSTTFALIIGNEVYTNEIAVPYALNDATIFSEYCKKTLGLPSNNVHVIRNATYGQMLGEIKWLQDVLYAYNGNAKAIFYYAGHGMPDEKDKSAYLLPVDGNSGIPATAIRTDDLYAGLSGIANAGVMVFLDACFSGAAREGTLAQGRGVKVKPKENILKENIIVFSATSGEETAMPLKEKGHGLYTYYLLKKLQESKGNLNLHKLTEFVIKEVKQQSIVVNSKAQNPKVNMSLDMETKWKLLKMR